MFLLFPVLFITLPISSLLIFRLPDALGSFFPFPLVYIPVVYATAFAWRLPACLFSWYYLQHGVWYLLVSTNRIFHTDQRHFSLPTSLYLIPFFICSIVLSHLLDYPQHSVAFIFYYLSSLHNEMTINHPVRFQWKTLSNNCVLYRG